MEKVIYKDASKRPEDRVADLLSRMTVDEKAAQMMGVWNDKKETLIAEEGNFDFEKASKAYDHGNGIGHVGRPRDAGKDEEASHEAGVNAAKPVEITHAN